MSAQLLRVYGDGISRALVDAAFEIVIDTAEHLAHGPESELVLDLDLMRLAAGPGAFARYSRQVFLEQRPLILIENDVDAWRFFSERRIQFFERLLERPTIFCLPVFRRRYESIARDNILAAIAQVRGSGSRERL
jgi:predicted metal-dependent HD superfamily phosphohydrolase